MQCMRSDLQLNIKLMGKHAMRSRKKKVRENIPTQQHSRVMHYLHPAKNYLQPPTPARKNNETEQGDNQQMHCYIKKKKEKRKTKGPPYIAFPA